MNNMVLVLAKNGSGWATKLVKKAAQKESIKTATDMLVDAGVTVVVTTVIADGKAALTRPFANRKNRRLAVQLAQQIGGTYSDPRAIIAGDRYWVVWQDETLFEVYPPLPEELGPLAERRELQNYQGIRIDPSADSS